MWSLQDETSLPSENERIIATEAMNTLRNKKEETLAKVEELKREADKLEYEIFKINAWLAPIRRVPTDVLSLIFIEVCRFDWTAPRELGLVCRQWREALLDTPRAWAFLQITPNSREIPSAALISLWISRCGAFMHHISLPPFTSQGVVDAVCRSEANIKCLSLFENLSGLRERFPHLEELRLGPYNHSLYGLFGLLIAEYPIRMTEEERKESTSSILTIERFPKLVSLHLHSTHPLAMEAIARKDCFPALRELHIHVSGSHWMKIIRYCAQTLITLAIEYTFGYEDRRLLGEVYDEVDLPQLQHLHYIFKNPEPYGRLLLPLIKTPNIKSYHQYGGDDFSLHPQASLATSVFFNSPDTVRWSELSGLTHLQIYDTPENISGLLMDLSHEQVCPQLTSIKCISSRESNSSDIGGARLWVEARKYKTGRPIEFQYMDAETDESYGGYSQCYTYCRCELPAEVGQQDVYQEDKHQVGREDDDSDEVPYFGYGYGAFDDY